MHKGLNYKEEYNKRCDKCDSRNSLSNGYPCFICTRNPDGHAEPSYDMWRPWEFYSNSGGCPANGGSVRMSENQDIVNNLNALINVFLNEDNLKFSQEDYDKDGENEENEK